MDNEELKNKVVCEKHFLSAYININAKRKILRRDAVPIIWKDSEAFEKICLDSPKDTEMSNIQSPMNSTVLKTYSRKRTAAPSAFPTSSVKFAKFSSFGSAETDISKVSDRIIEMPLPDKSPIDQRNKTLTYKINLLKKKLKSKYSQNYRLRQKANGLSTLAVLHFLLLNKSEAVKTFVRMLCLHKARHVWTQAERQLALSLYYKSPSAYKFMVHKLKFTLPSVRTIQSWLKVFNLRTGLKTQLIKKLAIKTRSMDDREKMCVVLFDEIALKKKLEYNKSEDFIEGYQDLGFLGTKEVLADTALVFYIRGLLHNWKIPLCYFTSAGPVKSNLLSEIIVNVVTTLKKISLNPLVMVCDQGSNNRSALARLGATKDNPVVEIDQQKIFTIFDAPHLLKSLRNNFMNTKLQFFINKEEISWLDIVKTYEIDQKSTTTRALLKITDTHISPTTFQKMRVKYAAQVFSHTVSAAIATVSKTRQLTISTALNTSKFVEIINNIFNSLNSRSLNDPNPNRSPLSVYNELPHPNLKNGLLYFQNIEVLENGKKRNNIYCLDGFQWTINSVLMLWEYLKTLKVKYLLTGFLNQDSLENFFSVIRNRGGYNPTPSVRQCRISIQHNMQIRLQMSLDSGNCEIDNTNIRDVINKEEPIANVSTDENNDTGEENECLSSDINVFIENNDEYAQEGDIQSQQINDDNVTLETCTNVYVAGYLAHILLKKTNCEYCAKHLIKDEELYDQKELFLLCKDYSFSGKAQFLKTPSSEFSDVIAHLLNAFNNAFEKYKCMPNVFQNIQRNLSSILQSLLINSCLFEYCTEHKTKILQIFIKIKLFRNVKWESEKLTRKPKLADKSLKPHRKMRILAH